MLLIMDLTTLHENSMHITELEYLRGRSLAIMNFIIARNANDPMAQQFKTIIERAYCNGNLKGLKTLSRDADAWAKGLPEKDNQELEALLAEQFGENLSGDKITHKVIKQVLKTQLINNEDVYRTVHEYLQDISPSDPFFENIDELEGLLKNYLSSKQ